MNPKIDKVANEISKTRSRIAEAQERLRELEQQKTEMEDNEIISIFRMSNIPLKEINSVIRLYAETGIKPGTGQAGNFNRGQEGQINE